LLTRCWPQEYVENQTLKEAIGRGLSEDESWRLFRQTLEALVHMASLGIVHRDLKPSNLLIGERAPAPDLVLRAILC
jgi:translation initiation factor 2-alpha kinase 4